MDSSAHQRQQQQQQQQQQQPPPQPHPQQQTQFSDAPFYLSSSTPEIPFDRKWHLAKIVMRIWSLTLAVMVIIIDIVLIVKGNQLFDEYYNNSDPSDLFRSSHQIAFVFWVTSLPPAALVLSWDCAEFITLCVRRKTAGRGIHPGAHVGMDLILWLILCIFSGVQTPIVGWLPDYKYDFSTGTYVNRGIADKGLRGLCTTVLVFMILLTLIHFTLFVRACVDTNQRKNARRLARYRQTVMFVPQQQNPQAMTMSSMAPPDAYASGYHAPAPLPQAQMPHLTGFYAPTPPPGQARRQPQQQQMPHLTGFYAPTQPPHPHPHPPLGQGQQQQHQHQQTNAGRELGGYYAPAPSAAPASARAGTSPGAQREGSGSFEAGSEKSAGVARSSGSGRHEEEAVVDEKDGVRPGTAK